MGIQMRVYYDNVIVSSLITSDVVPEAEMAALREIERAGDIEAKPSGNHKKISFEL